MGCFFVFFLIFYFQVKFTTQKGANMPNLKPLTILGRIYTAHYAVIVNHREIKAHTKNGVITRFPYAQAVAYANLNGGSLHFKGYFAI